MGNRSQVQTCRNLEFTSPKTDKNLLAGPARPRQVARATSAAPTYFKPAIIDLTYCSVVMDFVDPMIYEEAD